MQINLKKMYNVALYNRRKIDLLSIIDIDQFTISDRKSLVRSISLCGIITNNILL